AHHHAQARVGQRPAQELGEAPAVSFCGARVELLALIDIETEGRGLRLVELRAAALGGVDQIGELRLALQKLDPALLLLHALGIGRPELPGVEEAIDQRLDRLVAGPEREEAPLPAVLKDRGPRAGGARLVGPGLTLERRQNARL